MYKLKKEGIWISRHQLRNATAVGFGFHFQNFTKTSQSRVEFKIDVKIA